MQDHLTQAVGRESLTGVFRSSLVHVLGCTRAARVGDGPGSVARQGSPGGTGRTATLPGTPPRYTTSSLLHHRHHHVSVRHSTAGAGVTLGRVVSFPEEEEVTLGRVVRLPEEEE